MYPILVQIGLFKVSAFGFFAALGLVFATIIIWRLSRVYDLDGEKILDLVFWVFIAGLVSARSYFILINNFLDWDIPKAVSFDYHKLSLPGALIGGLLAIYYLCKRYKLRFWLVADIAAVGFFASLSIGSIGCLFAACQVGVQSQFFGSVSQVGVAGNRFPLQLIYALLYLLVFLYLWRACLRFHFAGKVLSFGLIIYGIIAILISPLRSDITKILGVSNEVISGILLAVLGIYFYYKQSKRSFINDLRYIWQVLVSTRERETYLLHLRKNWYNRKVNFYIWWLNFRKKVYKRFNVKPNPSQF